MTDASQRAHWVVLHGFESSPQSQKAQQLRHWAENFGHSVEIPQLPPKWREMSDYFNQQAPRWSQPNVVFIGSSMGGLCAHALASRWQRRAVLINPLVDLSEIMQSRAGSRFHPYLQCQYQLTADDVAALAELAEQRSDEVDALVLVQSADEVLPAELTRRYYQRQRMIFEHGGDHRFQGFQKYSKAIAQFCR
ncbi:hypothetical protein CWI84_11230 [Idiomarina tyrosinivorans]|uniref:Esterase n=1 Tax=Idiomarina tyrosinivorans TaxID=1445662 RepID=A0A432ZGH4_9GAMM|nr:YqiA/YcfP family alpha/beta fold hydrolase [Idiomarina tyrosinivorans]RUO76920.1 hypothetical protein CWI84_11230 [Idiomarina tyrosinivorans]